ncbi:phosphoribosyltransferase [Chondromyces apiculatus]|uniref:Phosphoribosyltransferase domain-containing protein n=1 Tax=Chondromyces apiculatus DSM 436 TaxID=1192034 RepID=A0A017T5Z8_9BACT|nr:phosphoribosyltransferase [Chondromyces apiculatus]EYF04624.1 Hypothetical protein CAP_4300 [Chondromyces apiculatus DSM 436]
MKQMYRDRREAGRALGVRLMAQGLAQRDDVIVLALPRGGVPVAYEAARVLGVPLDIFLVRKLGAPGQSEHPLGIVASGGVTVLNHELLSSLGLSEEDIKDMVGREQRILAQREQVYRGERPFPRLQGRTVVLVDDGLATGVIMRAAVSAARRMEPARLVIAAPIGAAYTCRKIREAADDVVCLSEPGRIRTVGMHYHDFTPTSDEEVQSLLSLSTSNTSNPLTSVA